MPNPEEPDDQFNFEEQVEKDEKALDDDLLSNSEGETGSTQLSNKIGDMMSPSRQVGVPIGHCSQKLK